MGIGKTDKTALIIEMLDKESAAYAVFTCFVSLLTYSILSP